MSLLLLVRHGQASFLSQDYDRLSPLGENQSRLLGTYWAERGLVIDQVYLGPRRRHAQTHDAVAAVYRTHGFVWPEPTLLSELDEYQAEPLLKRSLPGLMARDPLIREWAAAPIEGEDAASHRFQKVFEIVTRMWVRGELDVPDIESWRNFRGRVEAGIKRMIEAAGKGKTLVAFTSAGVLAAASAFALSLSDEKTLELSWVVRNAALAEFFFTTDRFSLSAFNATPHLSDLSLWTYR